VADWMHRTIGGLIPSEPGYSRIEIRPRPGGGLTHCRTSHLTPYGLAACNWKIEAGQLDLDVIIPPNTSALVYLPGSDTGSIEVGSGAWHWSVPYQDPDARGPFTVDDLTGDILVNNTARDAIMDVFVRAGMPDSLRTSILNERNVPLRQSLSLLPNYQDTVNMMSDALANI
jgi:alpha-L-rhamnosidase